MHILKGLLTLAFVAAIFLLTGVGFLVWIASVVTVVYQEPGIPLWFAWPVLVAGCAFLLWAIWSMAKDKDFIG